VYIHDSLGFGIQGTVMSKVTIKSSIFENCGTDTKYHCLYFRQATDVKIENCIAINGYTACYKLAECENVLINNCLAKDGLRGYQFSADTHNATITNSIAQNMNSSGILLIEEMIDSTRKAPYDIVIRGCLIDNCKQGIAWTGSKVTIKGNIIKNCANDGIMRDTEGEIEEDAIIVGNRIVNCGVGYVGIRIYSANNIIISNNRIYDTRISPNNMRDGIYLLDVNTGIVTDNEVYNMQRGGIWITGTSSNILVTHNYLHDNPTQIYVHQDATDNIVKRNIGYPTENSGTATITSGNTSVTVSHGLVKAPSKVRVTPLDDPNSYWYVPKTSITDTTFDIVLASAPATDVEFYWEAEV